MEATQWVIDELGMAELGDPRLNKRLIEVCAGLATVPGDGLSQAFEHEADHKAALRFIHNQVFSDDEIIEAHRVPTSARVRQHSVVLAHSDTSSFNWTAHLDSTTGLGSLSKSDKTRGLHFHSTLLTTPERVPLGVLDVNIWARDPDEDRTSREYRQLPADFKESAKWLRSLDALSDLKSDCPDTLLVSVADREADMFELLDRERPDGVEILVRARHNRKALNTEGLLGIKEAVARQPVAAETIITVPRISANSGHASVKKRNGRKARSSTLEIRFMKAEIGSTNKHTANDSIDVWIIHAREKRAPKRGKRLEWFLISTVPVEDAPDAVEKISWYCARWTIEIFHKILKSGFKVEESQLRDAPALSRLLVMFCLVAWRVLLLTMLSRHSPDVPCTTVLSEPEWRALFTYTGRYYKQSVPEEAPTIREATRAIARLGGFLGRKTDGEPGPTVIWRGLHELRRIVDMFVIMQQPA